MARHLRSSLSATQVYHVVLAAWDSARHGHRRRSIWAADRGLAAIEGGTARWTAHASFDDPNGRPDARPRESIEIRTLLFYD